MTKTKPKNQTKQIMKKKQKSRLAHLIGAPDTRVCMIAECYELTGRGRSQRCRKSEYSIDPAEHFTITELLTVRNGDGAIELARLDLTDPTTNQPALIWVGCISPNGR